MILLTGATGLLGSHVLYQLCRTEDKIRATKRQRSNMNLVRKVFSYYCDNADELLEKVEWVDADLLNITDLETAFQGVTKVYNCAAWLSFNPKHKQRMIENNVRTTANIVNLCLSNKIQKLCHVSSVAALGRSGESNHIDENTSWVDGPENSNYAKSKYYSELEVWRGIEEGLDAVIVNPSIILGPGQWESGSSIFFHTVWKGMPFYTLGSNAFVDVRDVANILIQLMQSSITSERFVICSENLPFRSTFNYIAEFLGKEKPHIEVTPLLNAMGWRMAKFASFFTRKTPVLTKETARSGSSHSHYDNTKIRKALNFEFIPVEQTCKDLSNMFLKEYGK